MSAFDAAISDDLLHRARQRERGALELIYRQFERAAFTLARRMTGSPDAASDVMQNSFLRAFERLPQFRGEAPFGRWLRAIVASEALMHLRSGRRFLELFEPEAIESGEPSVEDVSHADLERALGLLPAMPRAVLWLYHVEGYTHPEIAAMSGKTVSFSKSQLSRAHQRLRVLLDIQLGEPAFEPVIDSAEPEPPLRSNRATVTRSATP
ncbi:MAG: RNA polymerase sigma factor [Panacagrimonas sp.]